MPKKKLKKLQEKTLNLDWDTVLSAASGVIKKVPKTKGDLVTFVFTTPLDYVMAANKGILKQKFVADLSNLVETGKLDKGFLDDDLTRKTFTEIAEIIDEENPSVDKINAMKSLLVAVANKKEKRRYEISTHLDTLRELDSVEFNIIMSSYRLRKNGRADQKSPRTKDGWRKYVIEEAGWDENMVFEIERRESHLVELRLIDSHPGQDINNLPQTNNSRLTGLAIKIGDIITR